MPISVTQQPKVLATEKTRIFLGDPTVVAPAITGAPSLAEITTAAGTNVDSILYYTGTDTATDDPTYVYHVDAAGTVTMLVSPSVEGVPDWDAGATYAAGDLVKKNSKVFSSISSGNTGNDPEIDTAEANWTLVGAETVTGLRNFFDLIAPVKEGLEVVPSAGSNTLITLAGSVVKRDGNDMASVPYTTQNPLTFDLYDVNGLKTAGITAVPVASYDNGGVTAPVVGNDGAIWRLYVDPTTPDTFALLQPQQTYGNLTQAVNVMKSESAIRPAAIADWVEIARFAARGDGTNLGDAQYAQFLNTDRFGEIAASASPVPMIGATDLVGGAAGLVPAPVAGDHIKFLRGDATWADAGKDRVFADNATVAPAVAGSPTLVEVTAFAAAGPHVDTVIYYTGTDTGTDTPTHVYHVDVAGVVTLLRDPHNAAFVSYIATIDVANEGYASGATFNALNGEINGATTDVTISGTPVGLAADVSTVNIAAGNLEVYLNGVNVSDEITIDGSNFIVFPIELGSDDMIKVRHTLS